jgi:hypothetical protein
VAQTLAVLAFRVTGGFGSPASEARLAGCACPGRPLPSAAGGMSLCGHAWGVFITISRCEAFAKGEFRQRAGLAIPPETICNNEQVRTRV